MDLRKKAKEITNKIFSKLNEVSDEAMFEKIIVNPNKSEIKKEFHKVVPYERDFHGMVRFVAVYIDEKKYIFMARGIENGITHGIIHRLIRKNFGEIGKYEDRVEGDFDLESDGTISGVKAYHFPEENDTNKDWEWVEKYFGAPMLFVKSKKEIDESLELIKFDYTNYKHDPRPNVKVLDFMYPGKEGQKTYGKRRDILGWNINYFSNRKYAEKAVDEIDSFARLLDADDKEKYDRIKDFFPEQMKIIRRYNKKHVKRLKVKKDGKWIKASYDDLISFDRKAL